MLGMIIGIAAVILALSIGESAERFILSQISGFGSDVFFMESGTLEGQTGNPSPFVEQVLTHEDFKALKRQSWIERVSGNIFQFDIFQYEGTNLNTQVVGTTPDDIVINNYDMKEGAYISEDQLDGRARVAVIGYTLEQNVFGDGNAVGKNLKLGNTNYRIIGVLEQIGTRFFQNMDEIVFVPATTLMDQRGIDRYQFFSIKTPLPTEEARYRIETFMRDRHNIDNPEGDRSKDDFYISTAEDAAEIVTAITGVLQILLAAIAAISLLVGGVGIMNIMYVSVTERINEIGLRKAIGATNGQVLRQFLIEAILLTSGGGLGGVAFGMFASWLAIQIINSYLPGWEFIISLNGILFGVIVSTMVGLIFGYAPARTASKLDPITALRKNE